jgi:3D (Asp-Asp-Asp) domain-containing protein
MLKYATEQLKMPPVYLTYRVIYDKLLIVRGGGKMKREIPIWLKLAYIFSFILVFHFLVPATVREKVFGNVEIIKKVTYNATPYQVVENNVIDSFVGTMTGYGPDCVGCGGYTGCRPHQDVRNGNIYYNDINYGKLRIVASDKKYACGSIVRITAKNLYSEPFYAIILDRGGAIKNNKFDLLFASESLANYVGFQRNVLYEIMRKGW